MSFPTAAGCVLAVIPVVFIAVILGYALWVGARAVVRRCQRARR